MTPSEFLSTDKILVLDDILSPTEITSIEEIFLSSYFPWYFPLMSREYNTKTNNFNYYTCSPAYANSHADKNTFEAPQLVHEFVYEGNATSKNIYCIDFLIDKICKTFNKKFNFTRIKANCQFKQQYNDNAHNTRHRDQNFLDHLVMIYYVNNSDGNTKIFKEDAYDILGEVEPKAGRFVIFNGLNSHAGIHPKLNDYRILINFNIVNILET